MRIICCAEREAFFDALSVEQGMSGGGALRVNDASGIDPGGTDAVALLVSELPVIVTSLSRAVTQRLSRVLM